MLYGSFVVVVVLIAVWDILGVARAAAVAPARRPWRPRRPRRRSRRRRRRRRDPGHGTVDGAAVLVVPVPPETTHADVGVVGGFAGGGVASRVQPGAFDKHIARASMHDVVAAAAGPRAAGNAGALVVVGPAICGPASPAGVVAASAVVRRREA